MRPWLRRNGPALLALGILAPLTFWLVSTNEVDRFYHGEGTVAQDVAPGETADYGGAVFGPATTETDDGGGAPDGFHFVIVTVPVADADEDTECGAPALVEPATGRTWQTASDLYTAWDGVGETGCIFADTTAYDLDLIYLVPDDAGPFELDITAISSRPDFLRFALDS